jgi:hypothetical protein
MNVELVEAIIAQSHMILDIEPTDRLDFLAKALDVKQIILRCMVFLDDLKGSPYIAEYTDDDLALIHESFCDSALPLLLMIEHFLGKATVDADKYTLAI